MNFSGDQDVATRGIPSDILEGFDARINTVIKLKPKIVFVMGGLNDIYAWIPARRNLYANISTITYSSSSLRGYHSGY